MWGKFGVAQFRARSIEISNHESDMTHVVFTNLQQTSTSQFGRTRVNSLNDQTGDQRAGSRLRRRRQRRRDREGADYLSEDAYAGEGTSSLRLSLSQIRTSSVS